MPLTYCDRRTGHTHTEGPGSTLGYTHLRWLAHALTVRTANLRRQVDIGLGSPVKDRKCGSASLFDVTLSSRYCTVLLCVEWSETKLYGPWTFWAHCNAICTCTSNEGHSIA